MGLLVAAFSSPEIMIGWRNLLLLAIGTWVFPITIVLSLKASKTVDAGFFTILSNLIPVVTIIAATLLLNEGLSGNQFLGAAIIIISACIITVPMLRHRRASTQAAGVAAALTCFVLAGLATVYERWMLIRIGFGAYLIFGWGFQTLWTLVVAWPERKYVHVLKDRRHLPSLLGYSVSASLKGVLFIAALKLSGNASLVTAFISFTAILVVSAAYFVLHEKDWLWLKIGAAVMGAVGLLILNTRL